MHRYRVSLVVALLVSLGASRPVHAEVLYIPPAKKPPDQLQIDGGLSVIGVGYEHALGVHTAIQFEAFVFGTYFLPWFDLGPDSKGFGVGVRGTWFARENGHGLYVTPYFRAVAPGETLTAADGLGFTTGAFVGYAFALGKKLDLRLGGGAQFIHLHYTPLGGMREHASTPFVALDATIGYRL